MALALLTGFPGFLGTRLVQKLLSEEGGDLRVVALVEPKMADKARDAAQRLDPQRVEVIPGDITKPDLGLGEHEERLLRDTTSVFHLAAIYDLEVPIEAAQAVNVEGTGNVLDFCARCPKLERLNYVSTAYVAGRRRGVVYEHELSLGQEFKNHYESTKFQAELWVRDRMGEIPTTIYRPAIVVGDSKTGETQKFDGPYYILRVISQLEKLPLPQVGRAGAPFNVVPVDFVVDAIAALARDPHAVAQTVHLVDPEPITARELTSALSREYAGKDPAFTAPARVTQEALRFALVRKIFGGTPPQSIFYLNHPVSFDTRRATELLDAHGIHCPRFPDYAGNLVRFFREHQDDPAFAG
jgi:thioester reductase-like protein